MRDSETVGNAAGGLLPLFRDCLIGMPHSLQHGGRRRLGCAAAERWFGRVGNRKLDGLRHLSAGTVGLIGLLNPVTGVLLGTALAAETLSPQQICGLVLVLGGIVLGQTRKRHPAPVPRPPDLADAGRRHAGV